MRSARRGPQDGGDGGRRPHPGGPGRPGGEHRHRRDH
ncbi:hypothetical protein NMK44_14515 [Streptomyces sp. NEAU-Y11]|nr:hypothetical protein [Streptomyces sp. NEAU-Y11]